MAIIRNRSAAKGAQKAAPKAAPKGRSLVLKPSGKGKPVAKPVAKKPVGKPVRPAAKTVIKPIARVTLKPAAKPVAKAGAPAKPVVKAAVKPAIKPAMKPAMKPAAKPGTKPTGKGAAKPPILNAGAAKAKALAEARAVAAAAEAERKRIPRLVPATPGAIRPGALKTPPPKGKASTKPPAEVRPIGVLPPESMAKPTSNGGGRIVIPPRPITPVEANAARMVGKPDEQLTKADLAYFEQRLRKERSRIAGEMGHPDSSILKVSPRDSSGESGGYSFHMADAGTDSMEREISFDLASKEGRLLREIDDALRRIYNGVYGLCESSGKLIARARLETLPWARYTVQEQENIERQQRAGRLAKEEE